MNLLLLSRNIGAIKSYLSQNSSIGFIPTAGDVYDNPSFVTLDREKLIKMNYNVIDINVSNEDRDLIREKLKTIDALYVAGGNVFYLMHELVKKDIKKDIIDFVNSNKLYIGASAGSCICSPSLEPYQTLDDPSKAEELTGFNGLGIVNFNILPHYGKEKYKDRYDNIKDEYKEKYKIVPLKDNEAIISKSRDNYTILPSEDIVL